MLRNSLYMCICRNGIDYHLSSMLERQTTVSETKVLDTTSSSRCNPGNWHTKYMQVFFHFWRGTQLYDVIFAFSLLCTLLQNWFTHKGKNFLPREHILSFSKSFILREAKVHIFSASLFISLENLVYSRGGIWCKKVAK